MYKITELGMKVAERILLEEISQLEDRVKKNPDWESNKRTLSDFHDKLKAYGLT